ncbi:MAG: NBR1-Ig-like domain-containing protein [Candidatus Entotheonellia bacterium]
MDHSPLGGLTLPAGPRWMHRLATTVRPSAAMPTRAAPQVSTTAPQAPPPAGTVYTYDAHPLYALDMTLESDRQRFHDELSLLTSLQGIVNRDVVRLLLFTQAVDEYWVEKLRAPGGMLEGMVFVQVPDLVSLVSSFRSLLRGAVVWDPAVPATHTVAYTIAGAEDLVVLRYDPTAGALYHHLVSSGQIAVGKRLLHADGTSVFTGQGTIPETSLASTGSAKVDAQLWAKVHYLDAGLTNPMYLYAAAMDGFWFALHTFLEPSQFASLPWLSALEDRDFFIAKRAFFYDMSPWTDEAPRDDPGQPLGTDYQAWLQILASAARRASGTFFAHNGLGSLKYCDLSAIAPALTSRHECVALEHTRTAVVSAFNGFSDYGVLIPSVANTSAYRHHPPIALAQNPPPLDEKDMAARGYLDADGLVTPKVYLLLTMADYDAIQYLLAYAPLVWEDPNRGALPLAWGINPNHLSSEQGAVAWRHLYATKTANDYFVGWAGGGAGYLHPNRLVAPRPPSGFGTNVHGWLAYAAPYYRRFDYRVSSFLYATEPLDPSVLDGYATLSPIGNAVVSFVAEDVRAYPQLVEGVPFVSIIRGSGTSGDEVHGRVDPAKLAVSPLFLAVTPGLYKTPTEVRAFYDSIRAERPAYHYEAVDPYTFFFLAHRHLTRPTAPPRQAAQFLSQSVPLTMRAGESYTASVTMRNTGTAAWTRAAQYLLGAQNPQDNLTWGFARAKLPPMPAVIAAGERVTFTFTVKAPATPGRHNFQWQMVQEHVAWFGDMTQNVAVAVQA